MPAQNNITSSTTAEDQRCAQVSWNEHQNRGSGSPPEEPQQVDRSFDRKSAEHPGQATEIAREFWPNSESCTWKPPMLIQRWAPRAEVAHSASPRSG